MRIDVLRADLRRLRCEQRAFLKYRGEPMPGKVEVEPVAWSLRRLLCDPFELALDSPTGRLWVIRVDRVEVGRANHLDVGRLELAPIRVDQPVTHGQCVVVRAVKVDRHS